MRELLFNKNTMSAQSEAPDTTTASRTKAADPYKRLSVAVRHEEVPGLDKVFKATGLTGASQMFQMISGLSEDQAALTQLATWTNDFKARRAAPATKAQRLEVADQLAGMTPEQLAKLIAAAKA